MAKKRSCFGCLFRLLLLAIVVLGGLAIYLVQRPFPQIDGELHVQGLQAPVEILRDKEGVPHVYAANTHDLFFAQGYVHAQDRFWQMDVWRKTGGGRLSEMFGESTLGVDKFLRTLGWERVVREEMKTIDPESLALLTAYSEGVNAYLADRSGSRLSLEHFLLSLQNRAYKPEPWSPLHSLTWAKAMAWDLAGNMDVEIARAKLMQTLSAAQLEELFPAYPADRPVIVPETAAAAPVQGSRTSALPDLGFAWDRIEQNTAQLERFLNPRGAGIGSNNWVVAGSRTATGKPIIANDPHLGGQMPSIWYEVGLHCTPKGEGCPYEVAGYSFAGVPGVVLGHNDRIAWAFTNVGPDVMDLYIEKLNPADPKQYEVNGQWLPVTSLTETIQVAGSEAVKLEVRTTRHGPIISETYSDFEGFGPAPGLEVPPQFGVALRWTALEPTVLFQAIWKINRAVNWDEFRAAAQSFDVPAQNMLYADIDGNIGYQTPGKLPIRKAGDGMLPVPGWTDDHEWTGFIPFEQLPSVFNPPQGYIVTANNAVLRPEDPRKLGTDWDYGFRAQRIVQMIEEHKSPLTVEDVIRMQGDNKNLHAIAVVEALRQLKLPEPRLEQARSLFEGWDFQNNMDSAPAALFEVFWKRVLATGFQDDLPQDFKPGGGSRWMTVFGQLLQRPQSPWWDDRKTQQVVETRDDILGSAFAWAVEDLEQAQGRDPKAWRWGKLHTTTFENQTFGKSGIWPLEKLLNRGPFETSGSTATVNSTAWPASGSYEVTSLPSFRLVQDLADLSRSRAIHTTGQSGHAFHRHYVDQADRWRLIQTKPMLWTRAQIEGQLEGRLQLVPQK